MLGGEDMELTIKKILAIDREAEEYRKNMEQVLVDKKRELEEYIKNLENEYAAETEKMREDLTEAKINEARKSTEEIKNSKAIEIEKLNNLYKIHKDSIVNEIFKNIIGSN